MRSIKTLRIQQRRNGTCVHTRFIADSSRCLMRWMLFRTIIIGIIMLVLGNTISCCPRATCENAVLKTLGFQVEFIRTYFRWIIINLGARKRCRSTAHLPVVAGIEARAKGILPVFFITLQPSLLPLALRWLSVCSFDFSDPACIENEDCWWLRFTG